MFRKAFRSMSGATMVEYTLLIAILAVALIAGVQVMGKNVSGKFTELTSRAP